MNALGRLALGLLLALGGLAAFADEPNPAPADFRLKMALYGVGENPLETAQLLAHEGRLYQFLAGSKEAIIIDPAASKIELIDYAAQRRVRTALSFAQLDEAVEKLRKVLDDSAARREKEGGKANLLTAQMTRSLIEPKLTVSAPPDKSKSQLQLASENVEVQAKGAAEPDAPRRSLLESCLTSLAKLEWIRMPEDLPPFVRLQTLSALMKERQLRPTELTFIYRLAGPPRKLRWTFELVPKLTESELEAITRIDRLKIKTSYLGFARYERLGEH
ncbi:MAG TPA: hypothetical protein VGY53_05390, partial [Isosphaeraceae bacterium]|nr:hypothetical protein [Isosphaeraceae bacterium]